MELMHSLINKRMDERPAYGFSYKLRAAVEKDEKTPSPLDYYAEKVISIGSNPSKGFTFGGRDRFQKVKKDPGPGPGEYCIADDLKKKKKKKKRRSSESNFYGQPDTTSIFPSEFGDDQEKEAKPKVVKKVRRRGGKGFSFGGRIQNPKIEVTPGPGKNLRKFKSYREGIDFSYFPFTSLYTKVKNFRGK
jgi:hypothetical protein